MNICQDFMSKSITKRDTLSSSQPFSNVTSRMKRAEREEKILLIFIITVVKISFVPRTFLKISRYYDWS